jgi:branched-chain amino acid transport system permease protein
VSIGQDRWAEEAEARTERLAGWRGHVQRRWGALPAIVRLAILVGAAATIPFLFSSGFLIRVGVNALLLALLAVGLNVVVGWAGLLNLGYVAFYGFGAYCFALLSSDQLGVHLPTLLAVPIVVLATALLGLVVGLPSRRLIGDYLAIVTLFFGQIFIELTLNLDRLHVPWREDHLDITGGPNGIAGVDPFTIFGYEFDTPTSYYYLVLGLIALTVIVLYRIDHSRTGRAWRSIRDDAVASEMMTVPIKWLKLTAFATGAAVAGLAGSVFASFQLGVFPLNFTIILLITVYAALILGGAGSLAGAVAGGIVLALILDLLRDSGDPNQPSIAFYGVILLVLIAKVRPWRKLAAILGGTVALGLAVHAIADAISGDATGGEVHSTGTLGSVTRAWVVLPTDPVTAGNWAFFALCVGVVAMTYLKARWRPFLLVPMLYVLAFVWENRLVFEPSITRQLLLGTLLVVLMIARPQGLLGEPRVEV